ncbi:hypothetical protein CWB99_14020 [Pseudoalteromonas rubra]|uniref:Uncharacterized protein n=1 Tax=Pseudoalteromonas rubra TaxID=43658 RepID=A0A5S3WLB7_9GAMM|nr:hypothetical protein [Pseudoalteromonas rubra]TMP27568.1 hypothetical protein CWB99_14020 [Pseudoalteromonas rubra]TMP28948.1 hypothetical protein CWC00_20500 [Pseudoalteromonas rubra]
MKRLLFIFTLAFAFNTNAQHFAVSNAEILSISMRTVEYSDATYADMALVKFNKNVSDSAEGCVKNMAYLHPAKDPAIFSALLASKAQAKPITLTIDSNMAKIRNWCKLVAIEF